MRPNRNLEALVGRGKEIRTALDEHALSEVAALVLILHQQAARDAGAILPAHMMRSFRERDAGEKEGMRAAVEHVIVALVLLGVIDPPGA
jgi:hypothetical protein